MDTKHKITTLFLTVECVQMGVYEGIVSPGELASALFFFGLTDRPAGHVHPPYPAPSIEPFSLRTAKTQIMMQALPICAISYI
jgi:hypothetical protein